MKDKEARRVLKMVAENLGLVCDLDGYISTTTGINSTFLYQASQLLAKLGNVSIKDCPKCQHPVLAKEITWSKDNST